MRRLPGPADDGLSDGGNSRGSLRFVSGLAENTNSIFCADSLESQTANGCPVLQKAGTKSREAQLRNRGYLIRTIARSLERAHKSCAFLLTKTYMDARHTLALIHQLLKLIVCQSLSSPHAHVETACVLTTTIPLSVT